jgi:type II secretory pathway pseudopilin PulG
MAANSPSGSGVHRQRGFTYIGVLFLIVLMGSMLATAGEVWSTIGQRQRERELIWVGTQYAQALRSYYRSSPGLAQYPKELAELLEDKRFPSPQRHLRRLYPDPLTNSLDWGLLHSIDGRITGVYSQDSGKPLLQTNFPAQWSDFEGLKAHSDWQFVAEKAFLDSPAGPVQPAQPGQLGQPVGATSQ